jgi:hypothetical protein
MVYLFHHFSITEAKEHIMGVHRGKCESYFKEFKMKKAKYVLVPVLITLVVLVVSIYPSATVTRKASAAPRAAVVTKYLMIPAAAFTARHESLDYINLGYRVLLRNGIGSFYAPVYLQHGARIRLIKLFSYDNNLDFNLCASLYETYPKDGKWLNIKEVCTTGAAGNQQPTKFISHYVKWYYGYYIRLDYSASSNLSTFTILLKYTVRQ